MAQLYQQPTNNNLQYTLNSAMLAGDSTMTLSATLTGVVNAPGVCVVDRIDTNGNLTPTSREYIAFSGVSGTQLTGLTRGQGGSSAQAHSVGAIVEFVPDVTWANAIYSVLTTEHTVGGNHASLPSTTFIRSLNLAVPSQASVYNLQVTGNEAISGVWNASGASLQAFPQTPVWVFGGTLSAASLALGMPLDMPNPGTVQWITAVTRAASSNASLFLDITKNGTSILNSNGSTSLLYIPINGTYVSLGSIATPVYKAGDVFNFSVLYPGSMAQDLTVKFFAR